MPNLWWFEVRNTLSIGERRGQIDAAYLEPAQRGGMMLATLDTALAKAARALRVPLLEQV